MARILAALAIASALVVVSKMIIESRSDAEQNTPGSQATAPDSPSSQEPPTVAGIPRDEAQAILDRHRDELLRIQLLDGTGDSDAWGEGFFVCGKVNRLAISEQTKNR